LSLLFRPFRNAKGEDRALESPVVVVSDASLPELATRPGSCLSGWYRVIKKEEARRKLFWRVHGLRSTKRVILIREEAE